MNELLIICGPTATGKTSLGAKLAKKYNGEIVSADSRQVYQGMNIGTGKDINASSKFKVQSLPASRARRGGQGSKLQFKVKNYQIGYYLINKTPVWLYDIVEPNYRFSVADYIKCANVVIKDIWKRNKLPIVVGGTGFYLKGLIDGYQTVGIKPDLNLRKKLEKLSVKQLREELKRTCPERLRGMNQSDRNNPRRLIRAIEVASQVKSQKSKVKSTSKKLKVEDFLMIGIRADYNSLYQRIDERVEKRVEQGIEKEIKGLIKRGYSWDNSVLGATIGYKEWEKLFNSKLSACPPTKPGEAARAKSYQFLKSRALQEWQFAEHAYARRQMTWFKKDRRLHWFDISQEGWQDRVEKLIKKWYFI